MASFDPQDFGLDEPPPRPTTPPVRRGFLLILFVLTLLASLVYGVPYIAENAGYAWESGRSRAASEALAKLNKAGIIARASELFRMATAVAAPAVVRVEAKRFPVRGQGAPEAPQGDPLGMADASLGSGVIIDKDRGFVVTNNHVVKDANEIVVRLSQGTRLTARLVGADPKTDLAVLQISGKVTTAASWGDSDKLDIGDWVLAIGSPFALDHTVTAGIVSATQRNDLRINEYESFIQTDAAINPGNSGGPLIDLTGKVIGINTAIYTSNQSQGNEGIGLAIPSSMARRIVESLIKDGRVIRGFVGVNMELLTPDRARAMAIPDAKGAFVKSVLPGGPADKAGLLSGDVIVKLNGKDVSDPDSLKRLTADLAVGVRIPIGVYRDGKLKVVEVTIAEFPGAPVLASYGFRVREIPGEENQNRGGSLEIDQVVLESPALRAGLRPGLRILAVGPTPVHTKAEYDAAVAALNPELGLPLVVQTPDGQTGSVTINMGNIPIPRR
ncbi:trypsin-like peptidase domain-containing protein [Singulisphaera sp. Ch08]|uniref:Trypsin-like peptidase domain-containing protein n=1 Tax=Singulisphaera sp. Ch08 TaxID=3120278 RepID=A0AAU7CDV4_9BACT